MGSSSSQPSQENGTIEQVADSSVPIVQTQNNVQQLIKKFSEDGVLNCLICVDTVKDSRMCRFCSKIYCSPCIMQWWQTRGETKCPHCSHLLQLSDLVKCAWINDIIELHDQIGPQIQEILQAEKTTCFGKVCGSCNDCYERSVQHLSVEIDNVNTERNGLMTEMLQVAKERDEVNEKLKSMQALVSDQQGRIENIDRKLDETKREYNSVVATKERVITSYENIVTKFTIENTQIKADRERLEKSVCSLEKQLTYQRNLLKKTGNERDLKEKDYCRAVDELDKLKKDIKEKLFITPEAFNIMQDENLQMKSERDALQKSVESIHNQLLHEKRRFQWEEHENINFFSLQNTLRVARVMIPSMCVNKFISNKYKNIKDQCSSLQCRTRMKDSNPTLVVDGNEFPKTLEISCNARPEQVYYQLAHAIAIVRLEICNLLPDYKDRLQNKHFDQITAKDNMAQDEKLQIMMERDKLQKTVSSLETVVSQQKESMQQYISDLNEHKKIVHELQVKIDSNAVASKQLVESHKLEVDNALRSSQGDYINLFDRKITLHVVKVLLPVDLHIGKFIGQYQRNIKKLEDITHCQLQIRLLDQMIIKNEWRFDRFLEITKNTDIENWYYVLAHALTVLQIEIISKKNPG